MRTLMTDVPQCVITVWRLTMGYRCRISVSYGMLLILLVQIQGYASQTIPTSSAPVSSTPAMNSSEEDLSVHPGWWFPPVQFEHIILEPNDSSEGISNPEGIIIGGDLSFIISKDPPAFFYADNSTENGTDIMMNGTTFIAVEESYITIENGSVVEDDYIPFIVFPADDITAEILSPAMGPPAPAPMPAQGPVPVPAPTPAQGPVPMPAPSNMPPVPWNATMDNSTLMETTPKLDSFYSDS